MPEVVEMAQGGAVVPAADTRALAQAMRRFREDENYRRECGQRARECYREKFTPEKMAEAYLSLYGK
jgi:glycosyltransferase involved in cell wall biosynthesis